MPSRHMTLLLLGGALSLWNPLVAKEWKTGTGRRIMIVAHPLAARAGFEVFRKGGNVVDIAVASAYCLGVVEPHGSGIGGEGMMLLYSATTGKATVIDFKATSPAGATYETLDFNAIESWARSIKAASVPGVVAGLEFAREHYGTLDRATLLQPAIEFCLNGFEVDSTLALNLETYREHIRRDSYASSTFTREGIPLPRGTKATNPLYGQTLTIIQQEGSEAFYRGSIADMIARDAERCGGFITREDLSSYRPIVRDALVGSYRGFTILTTPPPCGGMFLLEALNILQHFDLAACRRQDGFDAHLLAEVFKMVFLDERGVNSDPAFQRVPVDSMLAPDFALRRLQTLSLGRSTPPVDAKSARIMQPNTTHVSVMDSAGNAVALSLTLSSLFGAAHTVSGAGFLLNNELQNFSPDPAKPNGLQPHKRVVTSLVPLLVLRNGKPFLVSGTPGGDCIISSMAQVLVNLLDHGAALWDAVTAPRLFSIHLQKEVELEGRFRMETLALLRNLGHTLDITSPYSSYFGAVQSVQRDTLTGILTGVSDPRRSGAALGE